MAGSPLGYKHTEETLSPPPCPPPLRGAGGGDKKKMRAPKSPEHLAKLRENIAKINTDRVFTAALRLKIALANGNKVLVIDTVTDVTKEYHSIVRQPLSLVQVTLR